MKLLVALLSLLFVEAAAGRRVLADRQSPPVPGRSELLPYDPVANAAAVKTYGKARFTVLTDRLVRMEYSESGAFEDRATPAVLNRKLPVSKFTASENSGVLTLKTDRVEITYHVGQPFSAATLSAKSVAPSDTAHLSPKQSMAWQWTFGQLNSGNLLGTIRSLDELNVISLNCTQNAGVRIHDESLHCQWGLVSRQGWVIVNDTHNWGLKNDWWDTPNTDTHDLYLFGHGLDYPGAIFDYTKIGGKVAMVPRSASGIMWSIWLNLDNQDVRDIVANYQTRSIPLDVYVLDMDWHTKEGWGGYSFDNRLFPYPQATMDWLNDQGLTTLCNLHDDDGVRATENEYDAMCAAIGDKFNECSSKQTVPFDICGKNSKAYMMALEDIVLGAVDKQGMDYYWIDWQQGGTQGGCAGEQQNPTIWLNKVRGTDHLRRNEPQRDMVLARWGGLGNHRYQIGFSGDVQALTWSNLAFQPYFSLTSANVAYGYWSHDIVGPANDHELHTRWIQWGALSGAFRTHDRGMSAGSCANNDPSTCAIVRIWNLPTQYFEACRSVMQLRQQLIPYIYTASRAAFDTGVGLLRPMYYDWPHLEKAYSADDQGNFAQYMFGPDILASPVVSMALKNTSMATKQIWLPPPASQSSKWAWFQENTGVLISAADCGETGLVLHTSFDLSEVPLFVRAGAVICKQDTQYGDTVGTAARQYTSLGFDIYPGSESGSTRVYEDDGATTAYLGTDYAWTTLTYNRATDSSSTSMKITIDTTGSFSELPKERSYIVRVRNFLPLKSATATFTDSSGTPKSRVISFGSPKTGVASWNYDGFSMTTIIRLAPSATSAPVSLQLETYAPVDDAVLSGMSGGLRHAEMAKKNFDATRVTPGAHSVTGGELSMTASSADELAYVAGGSGKDLSRFSAIISGFRAQFQRAIDEVNDMGPQPPFSTGSLQQLFSGQREDNCLCGSAKCWTTNSNYDILRVEGYQPSSSEPGAIPLLAFYSSKQQDNLAQVSSTGPSTFTPAVFQNGYILAYSKAGTVPLQLWHSAAREDYLTVASAAGVSYAKSNGYKLVNGTIGYVYSKPQPERSVVVPKIRSVEAVNYDRWSHSVELLATAFQ